jgi:hypothetical protein
LSNDEPSLPVVRRRTVIVAGIGAAALAFVGLAWRSRQADAEKDPGERDSAAVTPTLLAFIGALYGRELTAEDTAELSDRLGDLLAAGGVLTHEAAVLARHLNKLAERAGAASFESVGRPQQGRIVGEVMTINAKSLRARVLSRLFSTRRDFYRMRWSIVPQLAWLYRHSGAPWRARGYARWPGMAGDWHEITAPGAPYP